MSSVNLVERCGFSQLQTEVGENFLEFLGNSENECKTGSFKASYHVVGLLAMLYDIMRDIMDNLLVYASLYLFSLVIAYSRMNIVM